MTIAKFTNQKNLNKFVLQRNQISSDSCKVYLCFCMLGHPREERKAFS